MFLVGAESQTCRLLLVDWTLQDCEVATLGVSSVNSSLGTSVFCEVHDIIVTPKANQLIRTDIDALLSDDLALVRASIKIQDEQVFILLGNEV